MSRRNSVVSSFGFGVVESADGFDDARMLVRAHVRRALEHQVLEQMREAGVAGLLVLSAHVIPHLEIDHRHGMVLEQNHLQAIGKRVRGEIQLRRANLRGISLRGNSGCKSRGKNHGDTESNPSFHARLLPPIEGNLRCAGPKG